jgi:hypothetical protein
MALFPAKVIVRVHAISRARPGRRCARRRDTDPSIIKDQPSPATAS